MDDMFDIEAVKILDKHEVVSKAELMKLIDEGWEIEVLDGSEVIGVCCECYAPITQKEFILISSKEKSGYYHFSCYTKCNKE